MHTHESFLFYVLVCPSLCKKKYTSKCLELKLCKKYIHSCLTKYDNFIKIPCSSNQICVDNKKLHEKNSQKNKIK